MGENKTSFVDTYTQSTPDMYFNELGRLGYNIYHDRLVDLFATVGKPIREGTQTLFEIGALYGNTTQAFCGGTKWIDLKGIDHGVKKSDMTVYATDISAPALEYGKSVGLFSETYVHDMNDGFDSRLQGMVSKADLLLCFMALNYFEDNLFRQVLNYHRNNGGKYAIYSTVPMFDDRDYNPDRLLDVKPQWFKKVLLKHRDLESKEKELNGGMSESPTIIYFVIY
eukprot:TRINITY_DN27590_c0_g1_i1.p2 TRINITY_DN27590_c0_g1~~TRINITY_DN27590_c0_g1_i1.p2  ORF type:complete len:225 (+),score=112.02 TRINITY_DN27590_c0_g1_i1:81-755(+)